MDKEQTQLESLDQDDVILGSGEHTTKHNDNQHTPTDGSHLVYRHSMGMKAYDMREVTWTWCWGHLVCFQPAWWPKTTLSYVASKHLLHGLVEQLVSVVPLSLYIILFDYILVRATIDDILVIIGGLVACIFGLWFFLEGLRYGLMPLAEKVGYLIPNKTPPRLEKFLGPLLFFIIGTGVTMAEPSILALQAIGLVVLIGKTPYLYYMLNHMSFVLSLCIGLGVGVAFLIGFFKVKYELPFKPILVATLVITMAMTCAMSFDADLRSLVGLAWDCGAITTGEVTVPIIVGLAGGCANPDNPYAGLGLVSLGSLFPITVVQIFFFITRYTVPRDSITPQPHSEVEPWYEKEGAVELIETIKITAPLVLFLLALIKFVFRSDIPRINLKNVFHHHSEYLRRLHKKGEAEPSRLGSVNYLWPAIGAAVGGLFVFNVGLNTGLAALGYDVGLDAPRLFLPTSQGKALYGYGGGLCILLAFSLLLGYLATVAEPAMEILGSKVEVLSKGSFSKNMFIHSVSFGVGVGVVLGLIKIVYDIFLLYLLLPIYWLTTVLTFFSDDAVAHVAWDGGAVTTGPVTVPLVMALGVALSVQVQSYDGFGVLALASLCPITSVLSLGIIIRAIQWWSPPVQKVDDNEIPLQPLKSSTAHSPEPPKDTAAGEQVGLKKLVSYSSYGSIEIRL